MTSPIDNGFARIDKESIKRQHGVPGALTGQDIAYDASNTINEKIDAAGTTTWGGIIGTLSNQTDLQAEFNNKANSSHAHFSSNIVNFDEAVEDKIGTKVIAGSNVTVSYNDTTGETTINANLPGGAGDVVGPASSTDNAIARFNGTTGKLIQNSGATIDDSGNITATNLSGTNTGDNAANSNSGLVHTTGDETIAGVKTFSDVVNINGPFQLNDTAGERLSEIKFHAKNQANNGGVDWKIFADADNAVVGNRQWSLWGYPLKTSDGSLGGFERFITASFPTYDGNTTYTKQIDLDAQVNIGSNLRILYGNSIINDAGGTTKPMLSTGWVVPNTGGGDSTRITPAGTVITDNMLYSGSNRNGSHGDFYISGKLNRLYNSGYGSSGFSINSRFENSGILHGAQGHILQAIWGDSNGNPEGTTNDGGWGLEFGAHGNPYLKMIGNDVYIGRTDGAVFIPIASKGNGKVLTSDANGNATWKVPTNSLPVNQATNYTTSVTMDIDLYNEYDITAQAGALLFNNPSGTPTNCQKLLVRIKDNGTARALTYGTQFASGSAPLLTTTVVSKKSWMGFEWDSTDSKWYCIASGTQP